MKRIKQMKNHRQKINWLKLVLSVVTLIALLLGYFYFFEEKSNDLIPSVISDLVAVLIAVPIIYFVFTVWGISPQDDLKEDIIEGITKLNENRSGFENESAVNTRFDFKNKIKDMKQFDMLALSSANFLTSFRPELTEALRNGCHIRLLTIQPESDAANLVMEHQSRGELEPDLIKSMDRVAQILEDLKEEKKVGTIEIRGINWIPSCSIIIYNRDKITAELKIKVYPLVIDIPLPLIKSHTIVYKRYEPELFDYYLSHFNILWENSTEMKKQEKAAANKA